MNNRNPSPKGVLALIVGPPRSSEDETESHILHYYVHDAKAKRMKRNRSRKSNKNRIQQENQQSNHNTVLHKPYRPHHADFTLLYFCDFNCVNSRRFTFILAEFLKNLNSQINKVVSDEGKNDGNNDIDKSSICQLVCVPNDHIRYCSGTDVEYASIMSHLQSETEFWHLGFDHNNRLAIITLLCVTRVPTLIVIENRTGKVVSYKGMESVEWNSGGDSLDVIEKWRKGNMRDLQCCIS